MKNIEMGYHPHREPAFPFAKAELVDESLPIIGGRSTSGVNALPPWHVSSNGGSNRARDALHDSISSLQSSYSGCFNTNNAHDTPSNGSWIQQIQNILPLQGYNWCGASTDMKDSVIQFPSSGALNAGSLVLDSSRGELVNALRMTPKEILEAKALAASRSHSEAERRRRERINSHLATLRTIVPNSIKSDKASLLAEVIDQVKRLKRQVSDVYQCDSMPSESDELVVESDRMSGKGKIMIRASLCCDDRPDLMSDLKHALDTLQLRTVKVKMSTLGGRIKNNFIVTPTTDSAAQHDSDLLIKRVQEALRVVMERPGRGELLQGKFSKRQKLASIEGQVDC
eukprot:c22483_g2_i1 orf=917-1939(+)